MSDTSSTASTPVETLNDLDTTNAELGTVQLQILELLTQVNTEHQAIDARYAPRLNPLMQRAQELFDRSQALAELNRERLLGKGKSKTAHRLTASHSWKSQPRVEITVTDEELMANLRSLGTRFARRFIRRIMTHEVNRTALLEKRNRDMVTEIPGVILHLSEDYRTTPSGGITMSSAKPWWPALENLPGPKVLKTVLDDPDV